MTFTVCFNNNRTGVNAEFDLMKIKSANFQKCLLYSRHLAEATVFSQIMWSTLMKCKIFQQTIHVKHSIFLSVVISLRKYK